MFYKNVNKNSDKDMFIFLKSHFRYDTMNSWNRLTSIANNVKVYKLGLDYKILELLELDNYATINYIIEDWELEHPNYIVGFNGRSGGYLVLYNKDNFRSVLDTYLDNEDYEDFKEEIRTCYGSLKNYHSELIRQTELVQSFDKLCDSLVEECKYMLENCKIVEKEEQVTRTYKELEWL